MQFNIRHVLIWTTSLAVLLGVLRFLDLLSLDAWIPYSEQSVVPMLTAGVLLAAVFVVSLWAALGSGPLWLRMPILILALLGVGFVLGIIEYCSNVSPRTTYAELWRFRDYFWETDAWHMAWVFLAGSLLAASLVILRVIGYRLVRSVKSPPVPAASRAS
jgi:hypothetical protein